MRRYSLTGPEPPTTVRRIVIGPIHHWRDNWVRQPCRRKAHLDWSARRGRFLRYRRQCDENHYHWWNTDRSRPWDMLHSRSSWTHGYDADAMAAMHRDYRSRNRRHQ